MRETYFIQRNTGELLVDRHFPDRFRKSPDLFLEISHEQYRWAERLRTEASARLATLAGAHRGETIHIFGNGPSLNDFAAHQDWGGMLTIGVNAAAHEINTLRYWISADDLFQCTKRALYDWVQAWLTGDRRPKGLVALARFNARYIVKQIEHACQGRTDAWLPDHLFTHSPQGPADTIAQGLYWTASSCQTALDLARHMGCRRVYLWGLDYTDRSHSYTNAPDLKGDAKDNPGKPWDDYSKHVAGFTELAKACHQAGMQVYNANPCSKLDVFEKVDPASAYDDRPVPPATKRAQRVDFFTFFTAGTPYARLAEECVRNFSKHDLRVTPVPYGNGGDWMKNALARAGLLAAIADTLPGRAVGLLDSDVEPLSRPEQLYALPAGVDFAVEDRGAQTPAHNRYSAGVLIFGATPAGRALLNAWAKRCADDPLPRQVLREQRYLHDCIEEAKASPAGLRLLNLGNRYNRLPEQRTDGDDTVLLHTPASRKLLQVIGGKR